MHFHLHHHPSQGWKRCFRFSRPLCSFQPFLFLLLSLHHHTMSQYSYHTPPSSVQRPSQHYPPRTQRAALKRPRQLSPPSSSSGNTSSSHTRSVRWKPTNHRRLYDPRELPGAYEEEGEEDDLLGVDGERESEAEDEGPPGEKVSFPCSLPISPISHISRRHEVPYYQRETLAGFTLASPHNARAGFVPNFPLEERADTERGCVADRFRFLHYMLRMALL